MLFHTGVVAHEARVEQAIQLALSVNAQLALDDGTLGCQLNHCRTLKHLATQGAEYVLVLEDDAQPVDGFLQQVTAALAAAPTCEYEDGTATPAPIVSFYLGSGYPKQWQRGIQRAITKADKNDATWIISEHLLHAVAYAIRTDLIQDLLANLPDLPIDQAISEWARPRGHMVAYPWPSLCDHSDGDTVITGRRPRTTPRKAWRTGTRNNWCGTTTELTY